MDLILLQGKCIFYSNPIFHLSLITIQYYAPGGMCNKDSHVLIVRRYKKTFARCSFQYLGFQKTTDFPTSCERSGVPFRAWFCGFILSLSPLGLIMNVSRLNFPKTMAWPSGEKMSRRSCWRRACRDCPLPFYSQTHRYQSGRAEKAGMVLSTSSWEILLEF